MPMGKNELKLIKKKKAINWDKAVGQQVAGCSCI
jgi:hypothetical protein